MKTNSITRGLALSAFAAAALVAPAQPALADEPLILPVGVGCADFNLGVSGTGGKLHTKEFFDKDGNIVRILTAGKGVLLTYTNYGTDLGNPVAGKSVTFRTDGSVTSIKVNPDDTLTYTATGHQGLVMFPGDVPAGPSTTQYVGRIVFNVDLVTGIFTLVSTKGSAVDVCAKLAS
ncbi:hypothetical protein [Pseudarthrobacter raffinosi]|uniref:hypothetical protein n=1 Tax=Pseudarthrobacter raffinosi TaxID=2953651 RepID=UPI00208EB87B|nr:MULTISPECIES: hypothetical protein [unclassified Pseudarthrobacter]MCO4238595.1 hypothetical protein [Pseudarthrobacter sp. MDT3-28]MCO4249594.1 hypothetical protein [Pseudarthrobacter sp. MDT3-9]MCO4261400.1 hypothetical protein [Pseudarthrobacter sp. MDT3-26]